LYSTFLFKESKESKNLDLETKKEPIVNVLYKFKLSNLEIDINILLLKNFIISCLENFNLNHKIFKKVKCFINIQYFKKKKKILLNFVKKCNNILKIIK
jgi:hypothetical protein